MAKRKAYKALYLAEQHRRQVVETERDAYRAELREYQEALAPYGQRTMEARSADGHDGPIVLVPMDFVAMKAVMDLNSRIEAGPCRSNTVAFSWRGRPIHKSSNGA